MGLYSSHQSFQPQTYQRFNSLCLLTTTVLFVPLHPSSVFVFLSHDMPPPDSKHLPWRVCIKTHGHDISDMGCLCLNVTVCCFTSLSQNWEQTGNKLKRRPRRRRFFKKISKESFNHQIRLCVAWRFWELTVWTSVCVTKWKKRYHSVSEDKCSLPVTIKLPIIALHRPMRFVSLLSDMPVFSNWDYYLWLLDG